MATGVSAAASVRAMAPSPPMHPPEPYVGLASSERVTLAANTGGYAAALSSREEVREVKARQAESDTARTCESSAFESRTARAGHASVCSSPGTCPISCSRTIDASASTLTKARSSKP